MRAFVDAAGGLETAGYCRTDHWSGAFANSAGHAVEGSNADVAVAGIARRDGCDGVAGAASRRARRHRRCRARRPGGGEGQRRRRPRRAAAGRYEVVLEPTAVADVLEWLSYFGFNAKAVAERRSFVRLGDDQFDPAVTLVDERPRLGGRTTPTARRTGEWCWSTAADPSP